MPDHSPVPLIRMAPATMAEHLFLEIERLEQMAEDAKLGNVGYLLSLARLEAKRLVDQARQDEEAAKRDPRDLWRPISE